MEKQIDIWLKNGVINTQQAEIMRNDIKQSKKLSSQNRFIVAVSTIGAALLGIGAILFIGANWSYMTPMIKVTILSASTLLTYLLGYYFRYEKRNFPKVGSSLLFLSSLLIGGSLFLVTQIYHYNANSHEILLWWMLLLMPYLYTVRNYAVATLFTIIFYVWLAMFLSETFMGAFRGGLKEGYLMLSIYAVAALIMYSFGNLHKAVPLILNIGKAIKWISLQVVLVILFIFTFDFTEDYYYDMSDYYLEMPPELMMNMFTVFAVTAAIMGILSWMIVRYEKFRSIEFGGLIATLFLIMSLQYYLDGTLYAILFNFLIFGLSFGMIYIGYNREEIKIVNVGVFWICALIVVRYFDFFWDMLDTSVFFLVGGAILITGAVFLERGRRRLKAKFNNSNLEDG